MEPIEQLFTLNLPQLILGLLVALSGLAGTAAILSAFFEKVLKKPFGFWKSIRQDHILLEETVYSLKSLTEKQEQIQGELLALTRANKEVLGNIIDERYQKYISLGGIPANDVDDFEDIFNAYKALAGNHKRDAKYSYVKHHLKVIPVETKLVFGGERSGE